MARRHAEDDRWSSKDVRWMLGGLLLLALGAASVVFLWLLLAYAGAVLLTLAVRELRRRRRWRAEPPTEFWVDRVRD